MISPGSLTLILRGSVSPDCKLTKFRHLRMPGWSGHGCFYKYSVESKFCQKYDCFSTLRGLPLQAAQFCTPGRDCRIRLEDSSAARSTAVCLGVRSDWRAVAANLGRQSGVKKETTQIKKHLQSRTFRSFLLCTRIWLSHTPHLTSFL